MTQHIMTAIWQAILKGQPLTHLDCQLNSILELPTIALYNM